MGKEKKIDKTEHSSGDTTFFEERGLPYSYRPGQDRFASNKK